MCIIPRLANRNSGTQMARPGQPEPIKTNRNQNYKIGNRNPNLSNQIILIFLVKMGFKGKVHLRLAKNSLSASEFTFG